MRESGRLAIYRDVFDDMVAGARRITEVLRRLESLDAPQVVAAGGGQRMLKLRGAD